MKQLGQAIAIPSYDSRLVQQLLLMAVKYSGFRKPPCATAKCMCIVQLAAVYMVWYGVFNDELVGWLVGWLVGSLWFMWSLHGHWRRRHPDICRAISLQGQIIAGSNHHRAKPMQAKFMAGLNYRRPVLPEQQLLSQAEAVG